MDRTRERLGAFFLRPLSDAFVSIFLPFAHLPFVSPIKLASLLPYRIPPQLLFFPPQQQPTTLDSSLQLLPQRFVPSFSPALPFPSPLSNVSFPLSSLPSRIQRRLLLPLSSNLIPQHQTKPSLETVSLSLSLLRSLARRRLHLLFFSFIDTIYVLTSLVP